MTSPSSPSPTQPQPNEGTMSTAAEQIAAKARRLAPYFTSGIVTLQGPQGSGKSALVKALVELKRKEGVRCAAASLDDFYLPYSGLKAVAAATPDNALLQGRGLPGTHDIPLLSSVLSSIRSGQAVDLPSFDKSAHSGFGDRGSPTQLSEPLDLFLLEGWCINTSPAETSLLAERHPTAPISSRHPFASLEQINEGFRELEAVLDKKVDRRVTLDAPREWVYEWRIEQEEKLIQERGSGMTEDEVRAFVDRYMPVYECWDASGDVRVQLDKNRQIVSIRES